MSVGAVLDGNTDIAIGSVVGNSMFNMLGCLGLAGPVSGELGLAMLRSLMALDIWIMLAVALACLTVVLTSHEIARWESGVFLAYCAAYVTCLILAAQQHSALQAFSSAVLGFVVPSTVIRLGAAISRPATAGPP